MQTEGDKSTPFSDVLVGRKNVDTREMSVDRKSKHIDETSTREASSSEERNSTAAPRNRENEKNSYFECSYPMATSKTSINGTIIERLAKNQKMNHLVVYQEHLRNDDEITQAPWNHSSSHANKILKKILLQTKERTTNRNRVHVVYQVDCKNREK